MRALITGAAGQLGTDFQRLLPDADTLDRHRLSITDREAVLAAVGGHEVVLNCAAYNAVDAAEADPAPAFAVNADGPANLAWACSRAGARLVHYSTNYVFDGSAVEPYSETDEPRPLSAYARSKLDGERRVLEALPSALVIRSAGLFGATGSAIKGGSFPERMVKRAREGQRLRIVADHAALVDAEVQQHRLLQPQVDAPALAVVLGDAALAAFEQREGVLDRRPQVLLDVRPGQRRAALPGEIYGVLKR